MILIKTKKPRDRYRIIQGNMGSFGLSPEHPSHKYEIVAGVDRGNGYQEYMSIDYFLQCDYVPEEAKQNCRNFLQLQGYPINLE